MLTTVWRLRGFERVVHRVLEIIIRDIVHRYGALKASTITDGEDLVQSLYEALERLEKCMDDEQFHTLEVRPEGWTLKHPLACRPNLFTCVVNQRCAKEVPYGSLQFGKYRVETEGEELKLGALP